MVPQISVIVPVYNVEQYLRRCVDSILNQTFTDFEVILVDDGSLDNCPAICDAYAKKDHRIRVVHQANAGQAAARNRALDVAQGKYIAFVDSDDWIARDYLKILWENVQSTGADIGICGHFRVFDEKNVPVEAEANKPEIWTGRDFLAHCMFDGVGKHWLLWDKLFSRKCFEHIRLPVGRVHEDNATVYRLLYEAERVVDCDMRLYYYVQREGSTVHSRSWKRTSDYLLMWEEMCAFFASRGDRRLEQRAQESYFQAMIGEYPDHPQKDITPEILAQMRKQLQQQKKKIQQIRSVTIKTDPQYFEKLYPVFMKVYWTWKGILSKFRR